MEGAPPRYRSGITRGHNVFSFYKDDYTGPKGPLLGGGPGGPGGPGGKMPKMHHPEVHHYTEEDWEFISDMWDKEYIRGAVTLYWEDVQVGDHPTPICSGPWTEMANTLPRWPAGQRPLKALLPRNAER